MEEVVEISQSDLSDDALESLIKCYLLRTQVAVNAGSVAKTINDLEAGYLVIIWDPEEQSSNLVSQVELASIKQRD